MQRTLLNKLIEYILKLPDTQEKPDNEAVGEELYEVGIRNGEHGARLGIIQILQDHEGCICPIPNCKGEPCQRLGCKCCQGHEQCNGRYHLSDDCAPEMICLFCKGR